MRSIKMFIILIFVWTGFVCAQVRQDSSRSRFTHVKTHSLLGIKLGGNLAGLHYSDDMSEIYDTGLFLNRIFGVTAQYYTSEHFSINPDLVLVTRGQKINDIFTYKLRATYLDLHVAVTYHFNRRLRSFQPYIALAPVLGCIVGGDISYDAIKIDVSNANIKRFNVALRAAVGVQKSIPLFNEKKGLLLFEIARHHGITDTYASKEHSGESIALNAPAYSIHGKRFHRGWEFEVGVLAPLDILQKLKSIDPPESIQIEEEPVFQMPIKDCYTVDEIVDYYQRGLDIRDLKICMFNINFEFDKSELTPNSKVYVNEIADLLNSLINLKLQINGHTDSRGADRYNQNLSEDRALAVYNYLINEAGIEASRLTHQGFGESKPIDTNDTDDGRARNRRVEFQVIAQ